MIPPRAAWTLGMASKASNALSRAAGWMGRNYRGVGVGMVGLGIAGGTLRDDRSFMRSLGGGVWGGFKGGLVGGLTGGLIGATMGRFGLGRIGRLGTLGGALGGTTIGTALGAGFGGFKGGLGSNRPVNRIQGMYR